MEAKHEKAKLQALGPGPDVELIGDPIAVQFNPTSLRLQMANSVEGGDSSSRQARQYNGTSSTTLTAELIFDTADEGTAENPLNVRDRTAKVAQFLLPGEGSQVPPPRVRFEWGDFVLDGIMSALTEDIDLFSKGGVPLRSKVSITIKEQDPRLTALQTGPGSGNENQATAPGADNAGPGSQPGQEVADSSREALGNESPAEFAARNGVDPSAWRAVASDLDGLDLPGGAEIGFRASARASLGLGVHAGFEAGIDASLDVTLGLEATGGLGREAGLALGSAGGVNAAISAATNAGVVGAADSAVRAFGSTGSPGPTFGTPQGVGSPATTTPRSGVGIQRQTVDPRAVSFGRGVPLRPRLALEGGATVGGREPSLTPTATGDITVPGWEALPAADVWTSPANDAQDNVRPRGSCGHRQCCCGGGR